MVLPAIRPPGFPLLRRANERASLERWKSPAGRKLEVALPSKRWDGEEPPNNVATCRVVKLDPVFGSQVMRRLDSLLDVVEAVYYCRY